MAPNQLEVRLYPDSEPHKYQKEFHYWASKPETKFIVLVFPRQEGKTQCLLAETCNKMLSRPGIKVLWVAPQESQAVSNFEKLSYALNDFVLTEKRTHGQFQITLKNKSTIYFKPASSGSIRGMTINILIADEFQDILPEDFNSNILPVLKSSGKNSQTYIAGTPKGVTSTFYNWFRRESLGYAGYKTIHMQEWLNPKTDIDFVMGQKLVIPDKQWRAEYRAEWVSGDGFFSNVTNSCVINEQHSPVEGLQHFAGVDVGYLRDSSIISICNEIGEQVHCRIIKNTNSPKLRRIIKEIQQEWNIVNWVIEKNNQGLPLIQELVLDVESPIQNIHPFDTQRSKKDDMSKSELLNSLEVKMAKGEIKLLNKKEVIDEFNDFELRVSPDGKWTLAAPNGKHDDIVIATALSFYCWEKYNNYGEYFISTF